MSALVTPAWTAAASGPTASEVSALPQRQHKTAAQSFFAFIDSSLSLELLPLRRGNPSAAGPGSAQTAAATDLSGGSAKEKPRRERGPTPRRAELAMINEVIDMAVLKLHRTVGVRVGTVQVGGGAPVVVQSMTMTDTADAAGDGAAVHRAGRGRLRDGPRDRQPAGGGGRRARDQAAHARRRRDARRSSATSTTTGTCS